MNKIIIDNRTTLTDAQALELVSKVIRMGRISNGGKQYCYAVQFDAINNPGLYERPACVIFSGLNKKSDRFILLPPQSTAPEAE